MTINLLFHDYNLPEGASLYLYDVDHTNRVGAYTNRNNRADGELGTVNVGSLLSNALVVKNFSKALTGSISSTTTFYVGACVTTVTDEANKKIGIYSKSKPTQDMGFMRGKAKGDRVKVGCWIGETVSLSYQ